MDKSTMFLAVFCLAALFAGTPQALSEQKTRINSIDMEFVLIPPGSFSRPFAAQDASGAWRKQDRSFIVSKAFYLGKYEVSQKQWLAVMGSNPSQFKGLDHPVENVSWNDVQEFIRRLNAREKHARYRLPTEMEWEYAASAGTDTLYFFMQDRRIWADEDVDRKYPDHYTEGKDSSQGKEDAPPAAETTHPVGRKKPNEYGLYDLYGNVWEWVQDWYYYLPTDQELRDYRGPADGRRRVLRGCASNSARGCAPNSREHDRPDSRSDHIGFRLAFSQESGHNISANSIGMEFVSIPAGSFTRLYMVSNSAGERREKSSAFIISRPFYLGKYPVTQEQWEAVMGDNPSAYKGRTNPVEMVSWHDAQEFIKRLNAREGTAGYRLPTDMEWELAARGGGTAEAEALAWRAAKNNPFDTVELQDVDELLDGYAWFNKNANGSMHPVGQKKPNPYGLHDIYGNVWEWVQDWHADLPEAREIMDYRGPASGDMRVIRGGSHMSNAVYCRSGNRNLTAPAEHQSGTVGFRLALSPE